MQLMAKLVASIANNKRLGVLQFLDTLEIRANLTAFYHILAWISHLEVCSVCQYICSGQKHTHMHSN